MTYHFVSSDLSLDEYEELQRAAQERAEIVARYDRVWSSITVKYEVCPKSSWTSLSKVLDKHVGLKAYAFHKVQHQLN